VNIFTDNCSICGYDIKNYIKYKKDIETMIINYNYSEVDFNDYNIEIDLSSQIKINNVESWDDESQELSQFENTVIFDTESISFYLNYFKNDDNPFYKIDIPEGVEIPIEAKDLKIKSLSILFICGITLIFETNDVIKVKKYYDKYNQLLKDEAIKNQNRIIKLYHEIEGVDELGKNLLNIIDVDILLDHDSVIALQKIWSYDKINSIKMYDENCVHDEDFILRLAISIGQFVDNMVEIIQEKINIDDEEAHFISWESIKNEAIKYFSNIWESEYEKYLLIKLEKNQSGEQKTVDWYIESIVNCNEIDHLNGEVVAYITYFLMDKGYINIDLFFPACYDLILEKIYKIIENIKKNDIKNKLMGNFQKKKMNHSIDDIDIMTGIEFEQFVCELFSKMGYDSKVTKKTGDQGIDVIAEKNNIRVGIQSKCYSGIVGNKAIQEAVAGKGFYKCDKVMVISNNFFTNAAIELAKINEVVLWDRNILKEKLISYF